MELPHFDAVIVGTGFAGIYQLYKLQQLGLSVLAIDSASDIDGTWYFNRYPGASSDVHSFKQLYVTQPEVLSYLKRVVEKYDLRKYIQLNTTFLGGRFDENTNLWRLEISTGKRLTARYLITAIGALAKKNIPDIKNFDAFEGEIYHTAAWPERHDFRGRRVGIVGNGSTGSQLLVALSKEAQHVISFQRTPQWNVPNGNRKITQEERDNINENYDQIWEDVRNSAVAFGFPESTTPAFGVSEEERHRRFQQAWDKGNGFYYMFGVFSDITSNRAANDAATSFIKSKIESIVQDPETRRKLIPTEPYARRPITNDGYYEVFKKENVSLVSLKETPFTELTRKGAKTSDGVEHKLDVLIFATGFDAITGGYEKLNIQGRGGRTLKEHWSEAPTSFLGFSVPSFPNLFIVSGPHHPFTNTPPQNEAQIDFITDLIKHVGTDGATVAATVEAERGWAKMNNELVKASLFHEAKGWVFGDNVPGKKHNVLFFFGGLKTYREELVAVRVAGYKGYEIKGDNSAPSETIANL
ncbi:cyclohexanone monooxygenase [Dendryphion nanum]|uniref:Cyclohexanone monooxygenase n=1 Tax=Dendryphion nanum TaxID=256645 RepID=A0A9P9EEV9_9PLEO|nr:cyclohexanone monooxygenase [Dendryphion nanum]